MSSIVYQYDKRTGATYAYESTSYYDKEKKQPRAKRKYLGRVDEKTGEIIPTSRKRTDKESDTAEATVANQLSQMKKQCSEKNKEIFTLRNEINDLKKENRRYRDLLDQIHSVSRLEDK